jgi:hypothetical protein
LLYLIELTVLLSDLAEFFGDCRSIMDISINYIKGNLMANFQDAINAANQAFIPNYVRPGYLSNVLLQGNNARHHIFPWRNLVNVSLAYIGQNMNGVNLGQAQLDYMQNIASAADNEINNYNNAGNNAFPSNEQANNLTWLDWVNQLQAGNIDDLGNLADDLICLFAWQPWNLVKGPDAAHRPNGDPDEHFDVIANAISNNRFVNHNDNPAQNDIIAHCDDNIFDGLGNNGW